MNRKTLETGRRGREGVERKQSEEELRKQPIKQIQDTCGGKIRRQEGKLNTGQKTPEKPRKHIKLTYSETKTAESRHQLEALLMDTDVVLGHLLQFY